MTAYEVLNPVSGVSFGTYEADNPADAIEACCKDAGYASAEDAENTLERPTQLVAIEQP